MFAHDSPLSNQIATSFSSSYMLSFASGVVTFGGVFRTQPHKFGAVFRTKPDPSHNSGRYMAGRYCETQACCQGRP